MNILEERYGINKMPSLEIGYLLTLQATIYFQSKIRGYLTEETRSNCQLDVRGQDLFLY